VDQPYDYPQKNAWVRHWATAYPRVLSSGTSKRLRAWWSPEIATTAHYQLQCKPTHSSILGMRLSANMAAAIKKLIHEEFGDGIMSDIDFSMDIVREADPKGGRINMVLPGNSCLMHNTKPSPSTCVETIVRHSVHSVGPSGCVQCLPSGSCTRLLLAMACCSEKVPSRISKLGLRKKIR
jgi:hypothetical protein